MLKINAYSAKGTKLTPVVLPKEFEAKSNLNLLAQAIHVYRERAHTGLADTKTRSEINRTTKKWYKQKGTGGARHGARSAPIFVGGGVAHGPKPVVREVTLPQSMRKKALNIAVNLKAKEGKLFAVAGLSGLTKTREVSALLAKVLGKKGSKVTFVLDKSGSYAFRNIKNSKVVLFKNLNAHDVFLGGTVIIDSAAFGKKEVKKK